MPKRSYRAVEPLSAHASIHMLVSPDALPEVGVTVAGGSDVGVEPTVFLHVNTERRTDDYDHTATFTISGSRAAIDLVLEAMRAALANPPSSGAPPTDPES